MRSIAVLLLTTLTLARGQGQANDPVEIKWGVADSTAIVGKKFLLHIPSDAFTGLIDQMTIKTQEGSPLPDWLDFDPVNHVMTGIPTPKDVGQKFLELTATGPANSATAPFMLDVRHVTSHTSGATLKFQKSGAEFVRCKRSEPETVATLILDVDMEVMKPSERISLLNKFLNHMDLHEDMVKMIPVGKSPLYDDNALVSGSGDCMSPKTPGTFLAWPVGCGQVKTGHMPILQRMDDDSTSGKLLKVLDQSVIGWHVVNSHIQAPKRKRRQVQATATPVLTPSMPTMTMTEDSGEEALTRTVPGMSSPVIQPTATQPEMPKTTTPMPPTEEPKAPEPTEPEVPDTTHKPTPKIEPTMTFTEAVPTDVLPVDDCIRGLPPVPKGHVDKLTIKVGDIIDREIPKDLFTDCEVGDTPGLKLTFKNESGQDARPGFFLQIDSERQRIIGLPMNEDAGPDGSKQYKLKIQAEKVSEGKVLQASIDYTVRVRALKNPGKVNHQINAIVDLDYDKFKADVSQQALLANKVASIYGDSNADNLLITKLERGSVIYGWANKSLVGGSGCPVDGIGEAVDAIVVDGKLSEEAMKKMEPFKLVGLNTEPKGKCEDDPRFPRVSIDNRPSKQTTSEVMTPEPTTKADKVPVVTKDGEIDEVDETTMTKEESGNVDKSSESGQGTKVEGTTVSYGVKTSPAVVDTTDAGAAKAGASSDDNVLITTVVPAIVIVVILLIALIIACVLYRKKRKGNLNVEEQNTFVNKGAPVIFPNELEDKPNDVTKPLLLEGGNGNAGPPPVYPGTVDSGDGLNNHRNNGLNGGDEIQEYPQRSYEPPTPPITDTSSRHAGPAQQPGFSQHPEILP